jgi:hypothetical protein
VDATTGDHIWAEHYDRPLRNIFSLQDEIVRKIVTTLNLQLNLAENRVWVVQRTHNLEAYDYYLRGLEFFRNPFSLSTKFFPVISLMNLASTGRSTFWKFIVIWSCSRIARATPDRSSALAAIAGLPLPFPADVAAVARIVGRVALSPRPWRQAARR